MGRGRAELWLDASGWRCPAGESLHQAQVGGCREQGCSQDETLREGVRPGSSGPRLTKAGGRLARVCVFQAEDSQKIL